MAKQCEEKFDFLGYTFGRCYSMKRRRVYLGTAPSKKRVQRICRAISDETGQDTVRVDPKIMVEKLNRMLTGWANYFCLVPSASPTVRSICMPTEGCVGGYATNTRSRGRHTNVFRRRL